MKRESTFFIRDILENFELAEHFVKDIDYDEFLKDTKTSYAVIRCIEIMSEAAKHGPADIREKYPDIPWKDIAGMRDKIIHSYFRVSLEKVWLVLKDDIPMLKPVIRKVLDEIS
jgi:uncharacterized protein with HEPN domain